MLRSGPIDLAQIDVIRQNNADASCAESGTFAAQTAHRFQETIALRDFQLQELKIGLALFFQIAQSSDPPIFQDQHLIAAFFNVAQQVRRDEHADFACVANLAHQLQHANAGFGIETVCGLVEQYQLWSMCDGLRQLGQLLRSQ